MDKAKQYARRKNVEEFGSCNEYELAEAYEAGYHEAEKDLALAWEDMVTINQLGSEVIGEHLFDNWSERQIYEEVLRRFNEYKQKTK